MILLIKNAIIVNADKKETQPKDILIKNGVIEKIDSHIHTEKVSEVIDATGKLVMPGLIDIHVHFRVPGQEHKETIETGSQAAVKGGFTTVMCMPNTRPVVDNAPIVESIINEAKRIGLCRVIPIGAITRGQMGEDLVEMFELKEAGCLALSDDGKPVFNSQVMRRALEYAKMVGLLLIQHCEDMQLSTCGVMNEGVVSTRLGLKADPGISESVIVARDIELAHYLNAPVHFAHMSSKRSIELIRMAKAQGIKVTAEATPHHFTLTEEEVESFDPNTKMNPPLRTQEDVEAVKKGLKDGTIDCIATDHAPHSKEDKELGFDEAPFGIIGLETAVGLTVTELVNKGILTWEQMVDKMSTTPAKIIGLKDQGVIKEGAAADITILDPKKEWEVTAEDTLSKSKNTPFFGRKLKGRIYKTIFGGEVVYSEEE